MWEWVLGIFVLLVVLTAIASGGVFYFLFSRSPEGQWRRRVFAQRDHGRRVEQQLANELRDLPARIKREEDELRDQAFTNYLRAIPVSVLESYPGIGPATISRIEQAGYRSLADLRRNPNVDAQGLGEKRLADIAAAVKNSANDAWGRFQAGGCPEGRDVSQRIQALRASHATRERLLKSQLDQCSKLQTELRPMLDAAANVTLWRFITHRLSLLAPEWLERPMPDFDGILRQAQAVVPEGNECKPAAITVPVAAPPPARNVVQPVDLFQQSFENARGMPAVTQKLEHPPTAKLIPVADDLEVFVQFAYAVARSDGRIARREREVIAEHLAKRCGQDAACANRAKAYCAHYETAAIDLERCLQALGAGRSRVDCQDLYKFAEVVADASGPRSAREIEFLQRVAFALGLPESGTPHTAPSQAAPISKMPTVNGVEKAAPAVTREQHLAALEIDPATPMSADLVRRQYNLLTQRYAPEKFASAGTDFTAMADDKRAAVRAAALALLEPMGEPLEREMPADRAQDLRMNPDLDAMFSVP